MTGLRFYRPGRNFAAGWDFDKVLKRFFDADNASAKGRSYGYPAVDVQETETAYVIEADLPGFSEQDIQIQVKENILTLSSKQEDKTEGDNKKEYHLKERRNFSFERKFSLPKDVDQEKISARFKNGVLTLELQKQPKEAPKTIDIKIA